MKLLKEQTEREKQLADRADAEAREFEQFDTKTLSTMSPEELSAFQSSFLPSSPQFIVAAHEWNNRLVADHIKAIGAHSKSGSRSTLIAGFAGGIMGLLGGFLAPVIQSHLSEADIAEQSAISETHPENSTSNKPKQ